VADSPPTIARYSEFCALSVTGQGHVQSNFASDTQYRARFYVFDGLTGSGTVDVFEAYGDEAATNDLFKVTFNGTQFTFDAGGAGGGSASAPSANGWNLIEFDWNSTGGTFDFWVNTDALSVAPTGFTTSGAGTVEAVRLGAPNGFGTQVGQLGYDAFESHRTTGVGPLIDCDADGSGNPDININDILAVITERFGNPPALASGQPDCNRDGDININDILATIDAAF
jgi:hypothetical protein